MAKKPTKFGGKKRYATGGSTDRTQARYDRKVADIESDLEKALRAARGDTRRVNVARAKYEQRMADARDDLAGWRGQDRTNTRAEERTAERNLSTTRRTGVRTATAPERITSADIGAGRPAPTQISVADITPNAPNLTEVDDEAARPAARPAARRAARRAAPRTPPPAAPRAPRTPPPAAPRTPDIPRSVRTVQSEAELARALSGMGVPRRAPPGAMELRNEMQRRSEANRRRRESEGAAKGGKVKKMAKGGSIDGIAKRGKTRAKRKK